MSVAWMTFLEIINYYFLLLWYSKLCNRFNIFNSAIDNVLSNRCPYLHSLLVCQGQKKKCSHEVSTDEGICTTQIE